MKPTEYAIKDKTNEELRDIFYSEMDILLGKKKGAKDYAKAKMNQIFEMLLTKRTC